MAEIAIEHVSTDIGQVVGQVPSTDTPIARVPHTSTRLDDTLPLAGDTTTTTKKKKKKKSKKSTKSKSEPIVKPLTEDDDEPGPLGNFPARTARNPGATPQTTAPLLAYAGSWLCESRRLFPTRLAPTQPRIFIISATARSPARQTDPATDRSRHLPIRYHYPPSHR